MRRDHFQHNSASWTDREVKKKKKNTFLVSHVFIVTSHNFTLLFLFLLLSHSLLLEPPNRT